MYDLFNSEKSTGEQTRLENISTFQAHSFRTWSKGLTYKWRRLLLFCWLIVESGHNGLRAEALTRLLFRNEHSPSSRIANRGQIEARTSHSLGPVKPVDVQPSPMNTNIVMSSSADQSKKQTTAERTTD